MITDYLVTIAKLPVIQRILRRITFFIQAYDVRSHVFIQTLKTNHMSNLEKSTVSFESTCHFPMQIPGQLH